MLYFVYVEGGRIFTCIIVVMATIVCHHCGKSMYKRHQDTCVSNSEPPAKKLKPVRDEVEDKMDRHFSILDKSTAMAQQLALVGENFKEAFENAYGINLRVVEREFNEINQSLRPPFAHLPTPDCLICEKYGRSQRAHREYVYGRSADGFNWRSVARPEVWRIVCDCYEKNFGRDVTD